MFKKFLKLIAIGIFLINISNTKAFSATKGTIKNIEFNGNQRINDIVINSYLEIEIGEIYNKDKVNQTIKNLYKSDLFENVNAKYKNRTLTFILKENPVVNKVFLEGNDKLTDEILLTEISIARRSIFTKSKVKNDIKRITDLYRRSGRFSAKVDAKIIKEKGNRVNIVFEINEGKKAKVKKIFFIGNNKFDDATLKETLFTKEAKYLRFGTGEVYDPERLEYDKELLRRFYYSKGYADFETLSVIGEIKTDKSGFYVSFLLEEGIKYKFGEVNIVNYVKKFDTSIIEKKMKIKSGKTFNGDLLNNTVDKMVAEMGKHGYAFVDIEPRLKKDKERQIIDIDFIVHPVRKVYIGRIDIRGNLRTLDEVIRRELRIQEGDPYNSTKIERSLQRLRNLGFFKNVTIQKQQGTVKNQIDLIVEVEEQKTGELNFGVGYSTVNGANVNIGVKEKNLLGTGRRLSFDWVRSEYTGKFNFGYGKPYFLDRDLFAGFDVFYLDKERRDTVGYDQLSYGGSLNFSYNITEYLGHSVYYNYYKEDISNIDTDYNGIITAGETSTSLVGQSLMYDRRDNIYSPREGFYLKWTLDYAGIEGDKEFTKNTGKFAVYTPVYFDDLIFKVGLKGGVADGNGEALNPNDGFYLGGYSLRGFEYAGIGPRTIVDGTNSAKGGNALGGKRYYTGEAELKFPLGLPKEYQISGSLFINAGTVTGIDDDTNVNKALIVDSGSIRSAYGLNISWFSPMGPIGFDFSKVIKKESYDIEENFRFSFGSNF